MVEPLLESGLAHLGDPKRGKVRDVYDLGDCLLIVATDRISAFDVILSNGIPNKGRILNLMSAYWFRRLGDLLDHHLISVDDREVAARSGELSPKFLGRCSLVKKATPLPVEFVARGYAAGSLVKEVRQLGGKVRDLDLDPNLKEGDRLPEPIFTPATKAEEGHDINISFKETADLIGTELAEKARDLTLALYSQAARHAESVGLILADTKFEFGIYKDELIWIDEALTPDSSRYWEASEWEPGKAQPSFDKQFIRDWLEGQEWDKTPPAPALPPEVTSLTEAKYQEAYRRIVGKAL
jgi:phosphoribosylaminoimidazole-succinocarboxamide synthase